MPESQAGIHCEDEWDGRTEWQSFFSIRKLRLGDAFVHVFHSRQWSNFRWLRSVIAAILKREFDGLFAFIGLIVILFTSIWKFGDLYSFYLLWLENWDFAHVSLTRPILTGLQVAESLCTWMWWVLRLFTRLFPKNRTVSIHLWWKWIKKITRHVTLSPSSV